MSNFDFLRTGYDALLSRPEASEQETDFLRKVVSIMKVLMEEALITAATFVDACGRTQISSRDIVLALKYESRAFWEKDIEARFLQNYREEQEHTYQTDESSSGDEKSDEEYGEDEADEAAIDEAFSVAYVRGDQHLHATVLRINEEWMSWEPDDPVKQLLKRAIDRIGEPK